MLRVFFTATDGRTYRVYDAQMVAGRFWPMGLGCPGALYRVFVARDRSRRVYRFEKDELHDLIDGVLERQLRASSGSGSAGKTSP
jgi:hypothetical protein